MSQPTSAGPGGGAGTPETAGRMSCPRCSEVFVCGVAAGEPSCWCFEVAPVAVDAAVGESCLCPRCLGERAAAGGATPGDGGAPPST